METISGSCLCGEVTFSCNNVFSQFHFCHCTQCQKTSGSAHVANLFTAADNITWLSGEENVKRFDVPVRSLTSCFCSTCGSPVPYVSKTGKSLIVPAGSLNDAPNIAPQDNIFWSERATWYEEGLASEKFSGFPE